MVKKYVYTDNLPKVPVNLYEGTRTEYTGQTDDGGETTLGVYSAPLAKGDLVKLKDHSTAGTILVEALAADGNVMHGIIIDDPIGEDTVTATGGTPAAAQQRVATVAFFGDGIIELPVSETEAICPGDRVGQDASEAGEFEIKTDYTSIDETDQGSFIALSYAAASGKVAVLIGASCGIDNA